MKALGYFIALSVLIQIAGSPKLRGADFPGTSASSPHLSWLLLSPIPVVSSGSATPPDEAAQKKAFADDLLAAQGGEARVQPQLGNKFSVDGVEREWKAATPVADVFLLNDGDGTDYQIAYASTEFDAPSDADACLGVGSDDGVKVWLNGKLVHEKWIRRGVLTDEDVVAVKLKAGRNHLLLKVQNATGGWGFACRLMDAKLKTRRLVLAAQRGDQDTLRELIGKGFDVNAVTDDGLTPYLAAKLAGQGSVAEFLTQKGADTHVAAPPLATLVDRIFKEWNGANAPGCGVAIIEKGKVVFEKGYGIANLEYGVPITADTIFHVASVSKQFTAMAVVLLEAEGRLSLDDDVHKLLPELPDYGAKITIRNLLTHTSGIRDQWQTLALAGWSLQDVITQDQILRMLFRQKELNFPPGTKHLYCNGGFTLLAEIVKRASGKPLPQFCAERIFTPLGMTHTHFHQDLARIVPDRAYSYEKSKSGYAALPLNYANVGATSLFTTAGDLVKWLDNFRTAAVGGAAGIARLQEKGVLADGTKIDYGLGVAIEDYRGQHTVSHGGADAGYRSEVLWFPNQQWGVAVVSNLASFNAWEVARAVAGVCLPDKLSPSAKPPALERTFITLEPAALETYVGFYPLPTINQTFSTVLKDGKLWVTNPGRPLLELRATGPARFYLKEYQADVEFSPKGDRDMAVKIIQPSGVTKGERTAQPGPIETDLRPYAGVYWSEELETQYTILFRDGKLYALHAHHGEFALTPTHKDEFSTREWFTPDVKFLRDAIGKIAALTLGGGRVNAVHFTRRPPDDQSPPR